MSTGENSVEARIADSQDVYRVTPVDKGSLVLEILSAQEPGGGFKMTPAIAGKLGLSPRVLDTAAARITSAVAVDKRLLLDTAVILALLKRDFVGFQWEGIAAKSEKWLADRTAEGKPRIEGITLNEWVGKLLERVTAKV